MSAFRSLAWFSKGMREYTNPLLFFHLFRSGYESAASHFDPNELKNVRLDNHRVLITGANSGIGLVCCKELAKHGAEIHMVCRSKPRAEEARQQIISETGVNDSVSYSFYQERIIIHPLDLSKPNEVRNFGKQFANNNDSRLDILINNAGCMINEYKTDENGIEANFATNTLGTYILTESLIPALKKSPDVSMNNNLITFCAVTQDPPSGPVLSISESCPVMDSNSIISETVCADSDLSSSQTVALLNVHRIVAVTAHETENKSSSTLNPAAPNRSHHSATEVSDESNYRDSLSPENMSDASDDDQKPNTILIDTDYLDDPLSTNEARVITVSSGGMLVQKLDHADPMLTTRHNKFDGTMVYAQNKRQQVVMTEMWSKNYPEIFFCSMHPGWADTPAVALSMPSFYNKMKNKLRTPEQGADTAIWLAAVPNVRRFQNGSFFQDRQVVSQHLKLACTHSKDDEKRKFMSNLADIAAPFLK
ncbi:unnamed protein product [Schistosoma mattheei]|uniref:Uncharacterized protein n=1 Tax=Schistosoma mattheei TaxID=31246 RepID=A0A183NY33_9TREM|nr:unnamed protein product [Schistosoma mattheei]